MQTQAEQYLDALVSLELAAKMAERDRRPVNAAIRATSSAGWVKARSDFLRAS